jgi:DNA-directed RNA polymerase specialized sigma24 family protein
MEIDFAASEQAVKSFARRVMRRVSAAKIGGVTLADVEQECWIAWCAARDNFDPQAGVPFLAYLRIGMLNHINRWLIGFERDTGIAPFSIHDKISDDDELEAVLQVPVDEEEPDFFHRELALALLSDRSRQFVEILSSPPRALFEQLDRINERAAYGRKRGLTAAAPRNVTSRLVMDLMGCDRAERTKILAEIRSVSMEINQC